MLPYQSQLLAVMIIYLVGLVGWGIYQGRKVKTSTDFAIAGRNLPGWAAALSERATGESSWALLGLPGLAYATGLSSIWTAIGCVSGIIVSWAVFAWRFQKEAEKYDAQTFTDYLAKKHKDSEQLLRIVSSLTIVFFFFFYVGAQFIGGGKTLYTMFGLDIKWGILITALVIIPYTIFGGFQSVVYTDVIQALVMITALIIGPIAGLIYIAHSPDVYAHSITAALKHSGNKYLDFLSGAQTGVIIAGLSWFFGYLGGLPQLVMRFMAIKDPKNAKLGRNIGIAWTIIAYIGALTLGWIGIAIFGPNGLSDREFVMPMVMLKIFHPIIAGILITGAIAAMVSTADSLLILSSTELSENILTKHISDKKKKLEIFRITTAILAIIALGVAFWSLKSKELSKFVFDIVGYAWAGVGGTFSAVMLPTLFWKRYSGKAAILTILTGLIFTIVWVYTGMDKVITSRIMTFVVSLTVAIVSALIFPKKDSVKA